MFIDLHKALERVEENLPRDRKITFEMLEKAYQQTLWLRSHILGVMYDMIDFGSAPRRTIGEVSVSQTDSDRVVCLVIPEPLPGLKELTGTVEEHWTRMIHEAIAQLALIQPVCASHSVCNVILFVIDPLQTHRQQSRGC